MLNQETFEKFSFLFDFTEKHPFLPLFCIIPTVENTYKRLCERNVPQDIIQNILCHYEECVFIYQERFHCLGLNKNYFNWLQHYVKCDTLNVERLRFSIGKIQEPIYLLERNDSKQRVLLYAGGAMKSDGMRIETPPKEETAFQSFFEETDTEYIGTCVLPTGRCEGKARRFSKKEYRLILKKGDGCLHVHIPPKSKGPLTKELCDKAYARAIETVQACYPEVECKALHCSSWLLSQELKDILKETSNILAFQSRYKVYPRAASGTSVFNFVFKLQFKEYADMPEETSLQRAVKKLYLDGKYIYEYAGFFLVNDFLKEIKI